MSNRKLLLLCIMSFFSVYDGIAANRNISRIGMAYVVHYSSVRIKYHDKEIPIPIYGGTQGSIGEKELVELFSDLGIEGSGKLMNNMVIPIRKGNVREKFCDLLLFYKNTLFKGIDINIPSMIGFEGDGSRAIVWYDFNYFEIPSSMMLTVGLKDFRGFWDKALFDETKEDVSVRIFIGETSPFVNDNKDFIEWIKAERAKQ